MFATFFAKFMKNFLTSLIIFYSRKLIFKLDQFIYSVMSRVEYASEAGYNSMVNFYENRFVSNEVNDLDIVCMKCGSKLNSSVMRKIGLSTCPKCRAKVLGDDNSPEPNDVNLVNEGII